MNIFYLHNDPESCAKLHNNKHVVKMIIEYAQLMSTAHRVLDGHQTIETTDKGRKIKRWKHPNEYFDATLMKATHAGHPSAIWVRQSKENYLWLNRMWQYLLLEYTYRYGKVHSCERYKQCLYPWPENIPTDVGFTEPTPAMPDIYKVSGDSLQSYINYYNGAKRHIAFWKKREIPDWYVNC